MPAAAVIPAPIKNIEVVAVKKLVVGFLVVCLAASWGNLRASVEGRSSLRWNFFDRKVGEGKPILHCEQIGVFKAGFTL